jgi:DNA-binding transcriptional ArsR family regulator
MVNVSGFVDLAQLLQVIGQPARLQILLAIGTNETCVCHLEATFGWRQHLMALRKADLLLARRDGRFVHYRLSDPRLLDIIRQAAELQGVPLPDLIASPDCTCSNCQKEKA